MTINIVTLGCSKNLVDSEKLLLQLSANGHTILHNSNLPADIVIINTCGFILDAKTESIETILQYLDAKEKGLIRKVFVMGCLSQRYRKSLLKELPDVDGIFGVNDFKEILSSISGKYYENKKIQRILTTPDHYAYLKISEGCNRNCSFCAIPLIRGKQSSVRIEELVQEAACLVKQGVKELILIAQDLTSYGTDIYRKKALPDLLNELIKIDSLEWIRLHYTYPSGFPLDELVDMMKQNPENLPLS